MIAPTQWSKDNPFADQPQQPDSFSSDNPFVDETPVASASAQPTVAQTPQEPTPPKSWQTRALEAGVGAGQAGLDIAEGAGRAVVDLGKGVAEFAAQTAEPLNPDYKPGTYAEETKKGLKLGGEAAAAPFIMAYQGGKQVLEDPTLKGKAYGATTAGLGLLGLHEYAAKAKGLIPKTVDPVSGKPPAAPPSQPTPIEVLDKQAEVDKLAQQEKELADKKAKSKNSLLRAANAWNTLSADQRRSVINGLADEQYNRRWVDLSSEAKVAVKKALIPPESDTNSYTSQEAPQGSAWQIPNDPDVVHVISKSTKQGEKPYRITAFLTKKNEFGQPAEVPAPFPHKEFDTYEEAVADIKSVGGEEIPNAGSVPSAQGVGPEATTPTPEPPLAQEGQGSTAEKEEPHAGDISYMDLPTLRAERERAEAKLQQMDIQNDSPTLQEHGKHERDFWQKYKNDLESAMVKKMGPGSTTPESVAKLGNEEGPDISPDMPPGVSRYDVRKMPGTNDQVVVHVYDEHGNISETHGPMSHEQAANQFPKAKLPKTNAEMNAEQDALERQGKTVPRKVEDIITQQRTVAGDIEELLRLASKGEQDQATTEAINEVTKPPAEGKVVGKIEPKPDTEATPPLQSEGPAGPTTKGPEATKDGKGPTPGGSEATTKGTDATERLKEARSLMDQVGKSGDEVDAKILEQLKKDLASAQEELKTEPKLSRPALEGYIKFLMEKIDRLDTRLKEHTADELIQDTKGPASSYPTRQDLEKLGTDELRDILDRVDHDTVYEKDPALEQKLRDLGNMVEKIINDREQPNEYKQYVDDVAQLHKDLSSRKIDRTEWRKRADALAERKKALDKKYGNDPASRLAEDPLNYGKSDSNANPEDYPQEDTPSLEDTHQIEKLVNEPPPNTLELKYRESLNKMDLDQLDEQIDKARKLYDEQKISDADYRTLINDIADAKKSLKAKEMPKSVIPPKFNMPDTYNKDLSKFNDAQLSAAKRSLASMIQSEEAQRNPKLLKVLKDELNRMLDYDSEQRRKKEGGFLRLSFKRRAVAKTDLSALPHYEQTIAKRVGLEEDPVNPYTAMDQLRRLYARVFRQSANLGRAEKLSGKKLAAHESPYTMAQMSNGFLVQAEEYLRGNGPFVPDDQGGFVPTGAKSLSEIAAMVGNDVERLGWLAMARRELWERAEKNRTIGLDPVAAQLMYVNTPDIYHRAADALADYMHSIVDYDIWGGLVDPAERNKFTSRFYAPIERIFGTKIEGEGASNTTPRGQGKTGIGGDNPVKRYKGSTQRMKNPYETALNMTARNIRAANQNKVAVLLRNLAVENPKAFLGTMEPASIEIRNKIRGELNAKAELVKNQLGEQGQDLTVKDIERFLGTMGDEALAIRDNILNVWVDGKLEHWVVHPELAYAFKALTPHQLGIVTRLAGIPTQIQRFGIVNDPTFIMTMSMIDTFQAAINSKYGFVPVVDSFRGWWNAINNTEEYTNYRRGGGGNTSLTSKQYAKASTSLHDVIGAPESQTPLAQALHQVKTMHPLEAWRTIVAPVAEAARVGEYLRARGRGASVVESVFAAKDVVGNYSQMGGAMHALNHMALFLNPSLVVLDKTARVISENPARWFFKSSILGAAAFALYMANDGDQDIEDLRQTPGGQRYLFMRTPTGEIVKTRKPYLEGSIFMSGVEAAMDQMRGKNPEAFKLWRTAVQQELAINMLPTIGVIPAQLWANKDWQNDSPISPDANEALSPMFQSRASTGSAARIIGKEVNQSPAVIEWLARSQFGYLGANGIAAMEAAYNWRMSGEMPIPEELPFLNKILVKYPSSNVRPIRDFYDRAKDVERVAADMEYMAEHEPEMLPHYMESHQKELVLLDQWKDTRKELSDYRKSIEDVTSAPPDIIAPSVKHIYTDEFLRVMIETARAANLMHDAVKEATQ